LRQQQGNREEPVKAAEALEALAPETAAQSMPSAPSAHNSTGKPPAAEATSRRSAVTSSVGSQARNQTTTRTEVADVDHGSDSATPTASQSASCRKPCRSGSLARRLVFIVGSRIGYSAC
jgi:hypothetical protein